MQYHPQGLVGEHHYGMSLEVWTESLCEDGQGEDHLFRLRISGFGTVEHLADVVDRLMGSVLVFSDKDRTDRLGRCGQIEIQGFPDLRLYEQRWGSQVLLQVFEGPLALIRSRKTICLAQSFEKREAPFS